MDLIPSNLLSHEVSLFNESGVSLPCVGSIISSYLILTLASCLHGNGQGKERTKLTVKTKSGNALNSNSKLEEEQIRNISRIIFHPDSKNDLAILVLDENLDSSVKILPILSPLNLRFGTADEPISTNFSGRLCGADSQLTSFQISDSSECPFSSVKSDRFCLLPLDRNEKDSSCCSPFPGSSLICSDEKRGQFLCGILAASSEKVRENGQIYTNITRLLKWIESIAAETKAKINDKEPSKLNKEEKEETSFESSADDYDYETAANFPDFEDRARKTRALVGGKTATEKSIPYQLSLQIQVDEEWRHICGAVILDEKTAITAAHCFDDTKGLGNFRVVAGENRLDTLIAEEKFVPVGEIIIHPDYTNATSGNDLAILHVNRFRLGANFNGVRLSPFPNAELTNKEAVISGWGQTSNVKQISLTLQTGTVTILSPTECQRQVKRIWRVPVKNGVLCALNPNIRTCSGDSGGPVVIPNYTLGNFIGNLLVGIVSFGAVNCERPNTAGALTEISHFYDWIQENRAKNPCGARRLPCGSGGCYQVKLKCDKRKDCQDGTDEINCSVEEKTTTTTTTISAPCGGFINLAQSPEQEIIYKVPKEESERQRGSICLWVVSTGRKDVGASIEATILDNPSAQFNPDSDVIFSTYDFKIYINEYKTINEIGTNYTIQGPFMTVYYRTNSSAPNAGFHLKLKDSITQSDITERLDVKLIPVPNANLNEGEIQHFSYPSSISSASIYWRNQRTFFILKPQKPGGKIRLNLTFVDTQEEKDWLQIRTYQTAPHAFKRFTGQSNWTERIFEGLEDEPFLLYFHSDGSEEGTGFRIQYSETTAQKSHVNSNNNTF